MSHINTLSVSSVRYLSKYRTVVPRKRFSQILHQLKGKSHAILATCAVNHVNGILFSFASTVHKW